MSSETSCHNAPSQKFVPPSQVCAHLHATHAYAKDLKTQVPAHHYCAPVNEDMKQCLLYDSDKPNAKLIGIEYMVSEKLFKTLPDEEKKYWHSHVYEIKSGMLILPKPEGIAEPDWEKAEVQEMEGLISWYGKIYHLWQTERDSVPLGPPELMTSVTSKEIEDDQIIPKRDKELGIDRSRKVQLRQHIPDHQIHPLADKAQDMFK